MLLTLADLEDIELELASVVDKWFEFGVQLNVKASLLNDIRKDFSDPAVRLHQVCTCTQGPLLVLHETERWPGQSE